MIILAMPALVMLVGLLAYALAANPKVAEMGRIAFAIGLFLTLYLVVGHVVRLP